MKTTLKTLIASVGIAASLVSITGQAAESNVHLQTPNINLSDTNSLQRGASTFVNYCLSCHSASFMRYEHISRDLDISPKLVKENLMFAGERIGDLMKASMSAKDAAKWFGKAPPDLSTITRIKSPEYVYTFLKSFYPDASTKTGWNNAVLPNTAMPHVLFPLQGDQKITLGENKGHGADIMAEAMGNGSMTPEQFDGTVRDLTNFLVYLGEPAGLKRIKIGVYVMLFLGVLLILTWFLKKEYWRDVH